MANASELLKKNAKKIENIQSRHGGSKRAESYDRPWRENLKKNDTADREITQKADRPPRKSPAQDSIPTENLASLESANERSVSGVIGKPAAIQTKRTETQKLKNYRYLLKELGSGDRAIQYLILLELCNSHGCFQLSQLQLSSELNMNILTVRRMLTDFIDRGFIRKKREYDNKARESAEFELLKCLGSDLPN